MSYNVSLCDNNDNVVSVPTHNSGVFGTFGGSTEARIDIPYNYSTIFKSVFDGGINILYGVVASESIPLLEKAIEELGNEEDSIWKIAPGNAGHFLSIMLGWARLHPTATWRISWKSCDDLNIIWDFFTESQTFSWIKYRN